jgi:outer membrane receptor protein involved in Fe transport
VNSEFQNYDARLEYYLGANQFVTLGGFYKKITAPIEEVIVLGSDGTSTLTRFINAPEATLYGAEIEYRTNFSMPFELPMLPGADWLFAVNYTYTSSEVNADANDIVINPTNGLPVPASNFALDGSALQGTPENIANVQFGFETEATQLTLLVNWVDERILRRGLGQLPAVLEDPGIGVDLVFRHDFEVGESVVTFGLSGRNLLEEAHEEYQNSSTLGRTNINRYELGRSFSASLTAKF